MESMTGDRPYLLLTLGPLTTTRSVKEAMLVDLSTWDQDYNDVVQQIRSRYYSTGNFYQRIYQRLDVGQQMRLGYA